MGYVTTSILQVGGDIIFLWAVLFGIYIIVFAIEFVLHSIPYIRNVCVRYRSSFFNAGMNFTFVKLSFDTCYSMMFVRLLSVFNTIIGRARK